MCLEKRIGYMIQDRETNMKRNGSRETTKKTMDPLVAISAN